MHKRRRGRTVNLKGRNEVEQYAKLDYAMLRSRAWLSLSGAAVKVWIELRTRYNGSNNGWITLSLDEAARLLHLSKSTCKRAFDELRAKGFVALTRQGQWYGRQASEWAVTDRHVEGTPATRAWRQWQPSQAVASSVSRRHEKTEIGTQTALFHAGMVPFKYPSD